MVNKNIITVVGGLIGVAILAFILRPTVVVQPAPVQVVSQNSEGTSFGSVASPDIASPYLSFGGVRSWAAGATLNQGATTTLCAILSPSATTTLVAATLGLTNKVGTQEFQIGRGTGWGATTTLLASMTVGANTWLSLVATTSPIGNATSSPTALTDAIIIPNSWINYKISTGTPGVMAYTGKCSAVFREI